MTVQGPAAGVPELLSLVGVPNPQFGPAWTFAFDLQADADEIEVKLYTKAMVQVQRWDLLGKFSKGSNQVALAKEKTLSSGLYYVVMVARNAEGSSRRKVSKVMCLQ